MPDLHELRSICDAEARLRGPNVMHQHDLDWFHVTAYMVSKASAALVPGDVIIAISNGDAPLVTTTTQDEAIEFLDWLLRVRDPYTRVRGPYTFVSANVARGCARANVTIDQHLTYALSSHRALK